MTISESDCEYPLRGTNQGALSVHIFRSASGRFEGTMRLPPSKRMPQQASISSVSQSSRKTHQPLHTEMQIVREPVPCGNLPTEQDASDLALRHPVVQPI